MTLKCRLQNGEHFVQSAKFSLCDPQLPSPKWWIMVIIHEDIDQSLGLGWLHCRALEVQYIAIIMHNDDLIKWKHSRRYWPLCGEFTGHRWIPITKAIDAEFWCFLWYASEQAICRWFETPSRSLWCDSNGFHTPQSVFVMEYYSLYSYPSKLLHSWWRHSMIIFSALLTIVRGIQRWAVDSPVKGPVTQGFGNSFDIILNKPPLCPCGGTVRNGIRANINSWWHHQMERFSALLAICAGNSPVPGQFHAQRPVTRSFDVFFDLRLNKPLNNRGAGDLRRYRHSKQCIEVKVVVVVVVVVVVGGGGGGGGGGVAHLQTLPWVHRCKERAVKFRLESIKSSMPQNT